MCLMTSPIRVFTSRFFPKNTMKQKHVNEPLQNSSKASNTNSLYMYCVLPSLNTDLRHFMCKEYTQYMYLQLVILSRSWVCDLASTIMDRSLKTNLHFWRFCTRVKREYNFTCLASPPHIQCWNLLPTISPEFQHSIGWGGWEGGTATRF